MKERQVEGRVRKRARTPVPYDFREREPPVQQDQGCEDSLVTSQDQAPEDTHPIPSKIHSLRRANQQSLMVAREKLDALQHSGLKSISERLQTQVEVLTQEKQLLLNRIDELHQQQQQHRETASNNVSPYPIHSSALSDAPLPLSNMVQPLDVPEDIMCPPRNVLPIHSSDLDATPLAEHQMSSSSFTYSVSERKGDDDEEEEEHVWSQWLPPQATHPIPSSMPSDGNLNNPSLSSALSFSFKQDGYQNHQNDIINKETIGETIPHNASANVLSMINEQQKQQESILLTGQGERIGNSILLEDLEQVRKLVHQWEQEKQLFLQNQLGQAHLDHYDRLQRELVQTQHYVSTIQAEAMDREIHFQQRLEASQKEVQRLKQELEESQQQLEIRQQEWLQERHRNTQHQTILELESLLQQTKDQLKVAEGGSEWKQVLLDQANLKVRQVQREHQELQIKYQRLESESQGLQHAWNRQKEQAQNRVLSDDLQALQELFQSVQIEQAEMGERQKSQRQYWKNERGRLIQEHKQRL